MNFSDKALYLLALGNWSWILLGPCSQFERVW